jgi:IclR family acetate operon transcriptional repressor
MHAKTVRRTPAGAARKEARLTDAKVGKSAATMDSKKEYRLTDVKTAGRTLEIFEAFAERREPLSLSEIGRALNAPLSSSLYLVRALEGRGYLYTLTERRQIYPTRKLFDIGREIMVREPGMEQIEPVLITLRDKTEETVILGKRQGNRVVYLMVLEGTQTVRYTARTGELKPLHSSSVGKALLSALNPADRLKIVSKLSLDPVTRNTITDRKALLKDLERAAARGYSETRGENVVDVMAIAKPVWLGKELYAVAIAGPLQRMPVDGDKHIERLNHACMEIAEFA